MLLVVHDEEKVFWLMDTLLNKILPGIDPLTHTFLLYDNLEMARDWMQGLIQGGSLGSDESPSETKKFFEAILIGMGLNLVR